MSNSTLNVLLKEYENKRLIAEQDYEKRKNELYSSNKKLQQVDEELRKISFDKIKSILNKSNTSISDLEEKINKLKLEKEKILKEQNINIEHLIPKYECSLCNDTGFIKTRKYYGTVFLYKAKNF